MSVVSQENTYQFFRERYMKPDVTFFAAHDFISSLNETYQSNRVIDYMSNMIMKLTCCMLRIWSIITRFNYLKCVGISLLIRPHVFTDCLAVHTSFDRQSRRGHVSLHASHRYVSVSYLPVVGVRSAVCTTCSSM